MCVRVRVRGFVKKFVVLRRDREGVQVTRSLATGARPDAVMKKISLATGTCCFSLKVTRKPLENFAEGKKEEREISALHLIPRPPCGNTLLSMSLTPPVCPCFLSLCDGRRIKHTISFFYKFAKMKSMSDRRLRSR